MLKLFKSLTHSEWCERLGFCKDSFLVQESGRVEFVRGFPVFGRGVQPPSVDEDPGSLRDCVAVNRDVLSGAARDAEQGDVSPPLAFHQRGLRVGQLIPILDGREPSGTDHLLDLILNPLLNVRVEGHEHVAPLEGGVEGLAAGNEQVLDCSLQLAFWNDIKGNDF